MLYYAALQRHAPGASEPTVKETSGDTWSRAPTVVGVLEHRCVIRAQKKREPTSPPPLKGTAAISYLWPECVIRAMISRRLSATVALLNTVRSAALNFPSVALTAAAHLSMPSALG